MAGSDIFSVENTSILALFFSIDQGILLLPEIDLEEAALFYGA